MSKTAQIINRILDFIKEHERFLITGHARPDGDALGGELAFALFLKKMGKTAQVVHSGNIPPEYGFLPGMNLVTQLTAPLKGNYDALVVLDSDGFDRLEKLAGYLPGNLPILNIDHHPTNKHFGIINWADEQMSSVGEMVYRLIENSSVALDKNIALNLYVSLISDTGYFRYHSTTPSAHRMASELLPYGIDLDEITKHIYQNQTRTALFLKCECIRRMRIISRGRIAYSELTRGMYRTYGLEVPDTQPYTDILKSIKGVMVALLFRESKDRAEGIKVSIRSEPPVNSYQLARLFGGGGHYRAAGCTVYKPMREAQKLLLGKTKGLLP